MREIATGNGSAITRTARLAMDATPAGRELRRRLERGEHLPAGMAISTTKDGRGFEVVKAVRAGKVDLAAEKLRLARLATENRRFV